MHVLWLASWYPDVFAPTNGDFVQRHARAVAQFQALTVIHVVQGDPGKIQPISEVRETEAGGLQEVNICFRHHPTGIPFLDRFFYHRRYQRALNTAIDCHIRKFGPPDLVHLHVPVKSGLGALRLNKRYFIPFIVSEQSSEYVPNAPGNFWNKSARYRQLVERVFMEAAVVTNVSRTVGETLKKTFGLKEVIQVPNTVDTSLFRYTGERQAVVRFIHVSNLNEQKNISGLLHVFAALAEERKDWELVLVGPVGQHLEALLQPFQDKVKVNCTGLLPYAGVAEQMRDSSAFVLFSDHENFPCVIVEALCCGLPVITSTAGGSGDAIDPSNGETVVPGDEQALLSALRRMLDRYHLYDRMAIARDAASKYAYTVVGKKFQEIYQQVQLGKISS